MNATKKERSMYTRTTDSAKENHWKRLHGKQKIQYVWDYYKLPITVCLIFLYVIGYMVYGHFTKKDIVLYTGLVNVSAGEQLTSELSRGFLDSMDTSISRTDLKLYTGLYLTDDPEGGNREYAYASRIKILASIDNEQLDIVIMNREAFDLFSQSGYLYNMEELLKNPNTGTVAEWTPYLVISPVTQKDPAGDMPTEDYPTGLRLSQNKLFVKAGFEDDLYLGVIKNTPRIDTVIEYIKYLYFR